MRYSPAAFALSLAIALTASVSHGADREIDPRALALEEQGRALLAAGEVQAAVDDFEAALAIDPSHARLYLDLGDAARQQGLDGKAIHYYRVALDKDPGNLAAITGEGMALVEKGAVTRARQNLAQLQSLCGTNCMETKELASVIARGPQRTVLTAEASTPDEGVVQN